MKYLHVLHLGSSSNQTAMNDDVSSSVYCEKCDFNLAGGETD